MDSQLSDEELMLQYANGNTEAFELLYSRHKDGLYRFILRQCQQQSVTEEIFQDVWMKLINARHRYQVSAAFKTYLYQIARNRLIDYFRAVARTPTENADTSDVSIEQLQASQSSPERQLELDQDMDSLLTIVEALPEAQREAFLLKEEGGLSVSEIAEVMGCNDETAKSRLRYAVKKIRAEMGEQNG